MIQDKWNAIDLYFPQFATQALEVLTSYSARTPDVVKEIMEFDLPLVLKIIRKHLRNNSFQHCLYVQEQIRWWKRNKLYDSDFDNLAQDYTNPIYEMYLKISWDRYRDKESYEFDDYQKYDKLKESEVRQYFNFRSLEDTAVFFKDLSVIIEKFENEYKFNRVLQIIVDENFKHNSDIGFSILRFLINTNIDSNYQFRLEFLNNIEQQEKADYVWNLIDNADFKSKLAWKLSFFYCLNKKLISDIYVQWLLTTINEIKSIIHLEFYPLQKYLEIEPLIFQKILQSVCLINEGQNFIIYLPVNLFSDFFDHLGNDLELLKKSYIQQDTRDISFDYGGKGFLKILRKDPNFLFEYVTILCQKNQEKGYYSRLSSDGRSLSFVWAIDGIETEIIRVFDLLLQEQPYFGMNSHSCNVFFRDINEKYVSKIKDFLMQYVKENYLDSNKIDLVIDIARYSQNTLYEEFLLYYISLNQDVEQFKQIHWRGNGTIWMGDDNGGDIGATDWRKILSIVEKSNVGFKLIPIKKYLNERIESCLEYAESEKKRRFLGHF